MTDDRRTFSQAIGTMSALVAAGCAAPSRVSGTRRGTMQLDAMHKRLAAYVDRGDTRERAVPRPMKTKVA